MTTIEIEDYNGNTLCSFMVKGQFETDDILLMRECNVTDEENDYINNEKNLIRIQLEKED